MVRTLERPDEGIKLPAAWVTKLKNNYWSLSVILGAVLLTMAFTVWFSFYEKDKTRQSWYRLGRILQRMDVVQRLQRFGKFQRYTQTGIKDYKIGMLPAVLRAAIKRQISLDSIPEMMKGPDVKSLDQLSIGVLPEHLQEKVIRKINLLDLRKLRPLARHTTAEPWVLYSLAHHLFLDGQLQAANRIYNELCRHFPNHPIAVRAKSQDQLLISQELQWKSHYQQARQDSQQPNPMVMLRTSAGDIRMELLQDRGPNNVAHFISLVRQDFYDGMLFYKGPPANPSAVWTGCPLGNGEGGPGYTVSGDLNVASVTRADVAFVNSEEPGRIGSRFFIAIKAGFEFQRAHCLIGRVHSPEDMKLVARLKKGDVLFDIEILKLRPGSQYQPVDIVADARK